MRLSEVITIYLAAAAPFGVAYFLRRQTLSARRARALARAGGVALIWPLTAARLLLERRSSVSRQTAKSDGEARDFHEERKIEEAKRALVNSLRAVEDLLEQMPGFKNETARHTFFNARECVERYTGLTLAAAGARAEDAPSRREMELCRFAGRTGDDLLLAGRCTHRLNVSRLLAHRECARTQMLHALAAVAETAHTLYPATPQFIGATRRASEMLLRAFALTIELHSRLDDWQAAASVSRLLDAECARLTATPTFNHQPDDAPTNSAPREGESCTTPAAHKAFAGPFSRTTTLKRV